MNPCKTGDNRATRTHGTSRVGLEANRAIVQGYMPHAMSLHGEQAGPAPCRSTPSSICACEDAPKPERAHSRKDTIWASTSRVARRRNTEL